MAKEVNGHSRADTKVNTAAKAAGKEEQLQDKRQEEQQEAKEERVKDQLHAGPVAKKGIKASSAGVRSQVSMSWGMRMTMRSKTAHGNRKLKEMNGIKIRYAW